MATNVIKRRSGDTNSAASSSPWTPVRVRRRADSVGNHAATDGVYRRPMTPNGFRVAARDAEPVAVLTRADGVTEGGPAVEPTEDRSDVLGETKVVIVDDCKLTRDNLASVLAERGQLKTLVAWDLPSLFRVLEAAPASVILLNITNRECAVLLQAIFELNARHQVVVIGIAEDEDEAIVACAEAGVAGYHLRNESLDDLLTLIGRVASGETQCSPRISAILLRRLSMLAAQREPNRKDLVLTAREVQILRMLELGLSNRDIADRLCIAVHTVKNHVHSVLTKLGVSNRAEAAARFRTVRYTEIESVD